MEEKKRIIMNRKNFWQLIKETILKQAIIGIYTKKINIKRNFGREEREERERDKPWAAQEELFSWVA